MGVATRREIVVPKLVRSRPRHQQPIAYVVPLVNSNLAACSHLVAITSWLGDDDLALPGLPRSTLLECLRVFVHGFGCDDSAFDEGATVLRAHLGEDPSELPPGLFARDLIERYQWASGSCAGFLEGLDSGYVQHGHFIFISPSSIVLRAGEPPEESDLAFPRGGAYWLERPATHLVDLDTLFRANAVGGLRAVLGDLVPASASLSFERNVLDGRAMKWAGNGFLSPGATRETYQRERIEAVDRLGNGVFRKPVASQRWRFVEPSLIQRARQSRRSVRAELRDGRRRNLTLTLPEVIAEEVAQYEQTIMTSPPWPLPSYASEFQTFLTGLVRKVRAEQNEAFTQDYLGPNWRQDLSASQVSVDDAGSELACDPPNTEGRDERSIDQILDDAFGRELVQRARLTAGEKRVAHALAEMEDGDSLANWAQRNGMSPNTAYVHKRNISLKLERAKKLP